MAVVGQTHTNFVPTKEWAFQRLASCELPLIFSTRRLLGALIEKMTEYAFALMAVALIYGKKRSLYGSGKV
jgi:hypothetical protein